MNRTRASAAAQLDPSALVALFFSAGPLIAVVLWLMRDARRTGVGLVREAIAPDQRCGSALRAQLIERACGRTAGVR